MPLGAGKYDDIATLARERTLAQGVILIVIGGLQGNGFSVQATSDIGARLPELLRILASDIEKDLSS